MVDCITLVNMLYEISFSSSWQITWFELWLEKILSGLELIGQKIVLSQFE